MAMSHTCILIFAQVNALCLMPYMPYTIYALQDGDVEHLYADLCTGKYGKQPRLEPDY
jgi:hypothetical protein